MSRNSPRPRRQWCIGNGFCNDDCWIHSCRCTRSDIIRGRISLDSFRGLAVCGDFSYGDVLGSRRGWANSVLLHASTRAQFETTFKRKDTSTLGVCNGCQFLLQLKILIPGALNFPTIERNLSEQHEARTVMVEILRTSMPSVFSMACRAVSYQSLCLMGKAAHRSYPSMGLSSLVADGQVLMRYVTNYLTVAEPRNYPQNPNESPLEIAGACSKDGRVMICMPHPERTILAGIGSWTPEHLAKQRKETRPWHRIFQSASRWVD